MNYVKKLAFCIAVVLITVLTAGCSKNYTCADIAGTWTSYVLNSDYPEEWLFTADGKYTETPVSDAVISFGTEDSGKFCFEGDMIFYESDNGKWGNRGPFKVKFTDSSTMIWETEEGAVRGEFKKK